MKLLSGVLLVTAMLLYSVASGSLPRAEAKECDPMREFLADSQVTYERKGVFDSDPKPEFIQAGRQKAIEQAFNQYIASCFGAGRTQEYLGKKEQILGDLSSYVIVLREKQEVMKEAKEIYTKVKIRVNTVLLDGVFTASSEAATAGGDGSYMVWIFAAKKTMSTIGGTTKTFDEKRIKIEKKQAADTETNSAVDDGNTVIMSAEAESFSKDSAGGSREKKGAIVTSTEREYALVSTQDLDAALSSMLSLNNYEPVDYLDILASCGGEDIEVVQEQLALDGKMNAKTRKLVIGAMRDCEITYLAIGTIDINTPRDSNVDGGLSVVVSINGQVLDLSRKFPKKVAAIGPVQARAGGLEDNEAVRNALIIAGNMAGKEIVSRLHAKKIK